jgi:hypothetical protein
VALTVEFFPTNYSFFLRTFTSAPAATYVQGQANLLAEVRLVQQHQATWSLVLFVSSIWTIWTALLSYLKILRKHAAHLRYSILNSGRKSNKVTQQLTHPKDKNEKDTLTRYSIFTQKRRLNDNCILSMNTPSRVVALPPVQMVPPVTMTPQDPRCLQETIWLRSLLETQLGCLEISALLAAHLLPVPAPRTLPSKRCLPC